MSACVHLSRADCVILRGMAPKRRTARPPARTRRTTRPAEAPTTSGRLLLSELARREGVSPATVWRWIRRGALGADGVRSVLPSIRLGGRWAVEHDAYVAWTRRLAVQAPSPTEHPTLDRIRRMDPAELRRASARAVGLAEDGRA